MVLQRFGGCRIDARAPVLLPRPRKRRHDRQGRERIFRIGGSPQRGSGGSWRDAEDVGGRFWNNREWRMWVTDEAGATVCALRFSAERLIPGDEE
jgi:hypothetical protein